jgi:hypothetical protein
MKQFDCCLNSNIEKTIGKKWEQIPEQLRYKNLCLAEEEKYRGAS